MNNVGHEWAHACPVGFVCLRVANSQSQTNTSHNPHHPMSMYLADQLFGYIATILKEAQDLQTPEDVAKLLHSRMHAAFAERGEEFRIIIVESAREVLG
jgi:hypothetical protein